MLSFCDKIRKNEVSRKIKRKWEDSSNTDNKN